MRRVSAATFTRRVSAAMTARRVSVGTMATRLSVVTVSSRDAAALTWTTGAPTVAAPLVELTAAVVLKVVATSETVPLVVDVTAVVLVAG